MIDTVFVLSSGHSGSTLLDLLVGSHPRVMSLGEITYLPRSFVRRAQCTCGQPVPECAFWKDVTERLGAALGVNLIADPYALDLGMMRARHHVDKAKQTLFYVARWRMVHALAMLQYRYGIGALGHLTLPLQHATGNNFKLFDVVRKTADVDVVVDSSKAYVKGVAFYRARPDKVRFLLLSRDGRGVLYSRIKRGVPREQGLAMWRSYYERALPVVDKVVHPTHVLRVRYEDLTTNTEIELRRICAFLGLDYSPSMLDFAGKTHHMPEGNDMRMGTSAIRPDVAWQSGLSGEDLAFFKREGGALNARLGYAT